jgi:thymidine kinase
MSAEIRPEFEKQPIQPTLDVICGPMFSGKSEELIKRLRTAPYAGYKVQAFAPATDNRRDENTINSGDGARFPAVIFKNSSEFLKLVDDDTDIVGIDEAQFADEGIVGVCIVLTHQGKKVIVAGLDKNFRGEPFGPMALLKQEADHVDTYHAYCNKCGKPASRTQRIKKVNGERIPADYNDPTVLIGAEEDYEARCRRCHEVPGKLSTTVR